MEVLCNTLSIQERCVLFLNLVITKAALFNTHYEAYLHVKNCMTEIEEVYAQNLSAEHTLRMGSLDAFNTCEVAGIYWWKSKNHTLVLHQNGAYAIYRSPKPRTILHCFVFDIEEYKLLIPALSFPSKAGKELW